MGQKNKQILTNLGTMNSLKFVSTILKKKKKNLYVTLSLVVDDWICYPYNSENPNS